MIESNQHVSSHESGNLVQYQAAGFFQRLFEVHKKMFEMVKPKAPEEQQTPWLFTPVSMWSGGVKSGNLLTPAANDESTKDSNRHLQGSKVFILPNPVLWLLGFFSIVTFFLGCFVSKARSLDGSTERSHSFTSILMQVTL